MTGSKSERAERFLLCVLAVGAASSGGVSTGLSIGLSTSGAVLAFGNGRSSATVELADVDMEQPLGMVN
jgi:hypothetical protein